MPFADQANDVLIECFAALGESALLRLLSGEQRTVTAIIDHEPSAVGSEGVVRERRYLARFLECEYSKPQRGDTVRVADGVYRIDSVDRRDHGEVVCWAYRERAT